MVPTDGILAQQLVVGLTQGCVYALIAMGYTLVFGVLRVIFFAQGELCMIGAFAAVGVVRLLAPSLQGPELIIVGLAAALSGAVLAGLLAYVLTIRPIRAAPRTKQLVTSLGVSLVLQNAMMLSVSPQAVSFPQLTAAWSWSIFGAQVSAIQLAIFAAMVGAVAVMYGVLFRTRLGLRVRAVAEDPHLAELEGVPVERTMVLTFVLSSAVAGLAGYLMGSYDGVVKYDMGFLPGIKGFTAAVLGGFGNPLGAVVGGVLLGLTEGLAAGYVSNSYKDVIAFIVLVGVLIFRPAGLLPAKSRSV